MDLIAAVRGFAVGRPHVLVVPAVEATGVRLAVEAELGRRGWPAARNPADADLVVVAGCPGPRLTEVIDSVWTQVPQPRARVVLEAAGEASDGLDSAFAALRGQLQIERPGGGAGHDSHGGAARQRGAGVRDRAGADQRGGGHESHHGHHAGMEMPGGKPMAELEADRDGLSLDRLRVPLGPVLPDWPAGLVVRLTLQGDVAQEAEVEVLDPVEGASSFWAGRDRAAARELDALGRMLAVAGWDDAATRVRRLRDDSIAGAPPHTVAGRAGPLLRRIGRSRTLRWLVRGVSSGAGDVAERLRLRLAAVDAALCGEDAHLPPVDVERLPSLLVGVEFAAVRLIVAAIDPDTDVGAARRGEALPGEASHG